MSDTPNLVLPEISSSQSSKEVTHNEALRIIDGLLQTGIIDKDLTAPPGGESHGDLYIVGPSATGAWAGYDDYIAHYYNSAWYFYQPNEGWRVWINDEDSIYIYTGSGWEEFSIVAIPSTDYDLILFPEYPGAVLSASGSNNDPGTEGMTSESEVISNVRRNYYEWSSDIETGLQSYDIVVQIPIPLGFDGFRTGTNQALTLEIKTEENTTTNNKLDVTINRDGQATTSSLTAQKSAVADTWETIGFDETDSVLAAVQAGEILNVAIRMYSQNSKYVRIGKIKLEISE